VTHIGERTRPSADGADRLGTAEELRMVVQAYILVQTNVGKAADVARAIAALQGVTLAEDVTGPYDVIVRAEAASVDELGQLVVARVQNVPGITRTVTCPVVHI
jgi:DNA-binding Lrp family transcriptional regulator